MKQLTQDSKTATAKVTFWGLVWLIVAVLIVAGGYVQFSAAGDPSPTAQPAVQIPGPTQAYIGLSRMSLAQQLGVDLNQIDLASVTEPASTDGVYIVKLAVAGQTYEYHGQDQQVTLVSEPLPLAPSSTSPGGDGMPQVTLDLDSAVAAAMMQRTIPAVEATDQTPYWALLPDHVEVGLTDYAQPNSVQMPTIYVYPVAELKEMNQTGPDQVDQLAELLNKKPDLATIKPLPFLPLFNAQSMFNVQAQYMDFANGSGIRYLTQFGQAAGPVTNEELFYTFQGLTDDGAYYVAAVLPIAQSDLPADTASADTRFADGFEAYIQGVMEGLATAAPDSFTPKLETLDNMVHTISVR